MLQTTRRNALDHTPAHPEGIQDGGLAPRAVAKVADAVDVGEVVVEARHAGGGELFEGFTSAGHLECAEDVEHFWHVVFCPPKEKVTLRSGEVDGTEATHCL